MQNVRIAALEVLLRICHGHLVSLGLSTLVNALVPPPNTSVVGPTSASIEGVAWSMCPKRAAIQDCVVATLVKVPHAVSYLL